jgi:CubicO group peptidase (beta-lactamase class C family)
MKKIFSVLLPALLIIACRENKKVNPAETVHFDTTYHPAVFTNPERIHKIKKAMPVIDSIYKKYALANHFPGISFGIVVDGALIYKNSYGYTDLAKKIPVSSSSLFRIASMSKSFTTMAILKLRDEGKLNLDDPAYFYIPELKDLTYPTADSPPITIRHLMTHGAGFPEDNPWGDRQLADTDKDLMEFIGKQIIFSNPPGIAYEYSNLGFALQGKIITKVSGMPFQDYIKKHILEPLGMNTATYEFADVAMEKLAHGYRWLNNQWNEETLLHDTPDGSWGAMGGLICSVDEFAKYMAFHLSAWPPGNAEDDGPVKRSSVREMHHPWRLKDLNTDFKYPDGRTCAMVTAYNYGLGWMKDCDNKTYIGHSGGLPGFGSQWQIMPDYGIGVVAFANRTYAPFSYVNIQVLDTLVKLAGLEPRQLPASEILEKRKKELLQLLPNWNKAEQSSIFAENFFPDYPIDTLKKITGDLYEKAGKIISIKEIQPENQLRGSFIIEGEKTNLEIYFTLSPENPPLIQAFRIREKRVEK